MVPLCAIAALAVVGTVRAGSEAVPSASTVLKDIEAEGAAAIFRRLWQDERTFDAVCDAIEQGDPGWLEVSARLKPVSDGAAALSLNFSVARALPRDPRRVLRLVGHGFRLEDICTSPFVEPDAGVAEAYETLALAALAAVSEPKLERVAKECVVKVRLPKP